MMWLSNGPTFCWLWPEAERAEEEEEEEELEGGGTALSLLLVLRGRAPRAAGRVGVGDVEENG